jgi:hypothetical protein
MGSHEKRIMVNQQQYIQSISPGKQAKLIPVQTVQLDDQEEGDMRYHGSNKISGYRPQVNN